jgi:hypothetical protein
MYEDEPIETPIYRETGTIPTEHWEEPTEDSLGAQQRCAVPTPCGHFVISSD